MITTMYNVQILAANSKSSPGTFVYGNGSPIIYHEWAPGQPVIKDALECVMMSVDRSWMWVAAPCTQTWKFVCEVQVGKWKDNLANQG